MKKEYRLKKNHEIATVVNLRQRLSSECYNLYYQKSKEQAKIAISVSKKYGTAVERNYAKRVVREILRNIYPNLPQVKIVLVVKNQSKFKKFSEKKNNLTKLIEVLMRKEQKKNEK